MNERTNVSQYDKLLYYNSSNTTINPCGLMDCQRRSKTESYIEACLLCVLMIVSDIGNIIVLVLILKVPNLKKRSNILVANLAIADIWFITINVPFTVSILISDKWIFNDAVCQLSGALFFTSAIVALLDLTAISLCRYFQICKPEFYVKYFTVPLCIGLVVGIWLASVLVSIPPALGWGVFKFSYGQAICTNYWPSSTSYFFVVMFTAVFVPFAIIVLAYISIVKTVLKSRRRVLTHAGENHNTGRTWYRIDRADVQLSKMSFVICIAFFVCWSPISILNAYLLNKNEVSIKWEMLAMFFMYVNTLIDPLIYAFMNGPFRREFRSIFRARTSQTDQSNGE